MSETRIRLGTRLGVRLRPEARERVDVPDVPRPRVPDQVMLPLLDRIVRQSLDEDYEVVARRKQAELKAARARRRARNRGLARNRQRPAKPAPPRVRPRRVAAAVMAVFGVLVAIAAVQTARNAPAANAGRASLIEQIQERRATVTRLQGRLDRLQASVTGLRETASQTAEAEQVLAARSERIASRTGFAAVRGPGIRITVDDTPDGDITQVVRSSDLAMLVDGLWSAGAEAMAVNNLRITPLTAFSNVGPGRAPGRQASRGAVRAGGRRRPRHPRRGPAGQLVRAALLLPQGQPRLPVRDQEGG